MGLFLRITAGVFIVFLSVAMAYAFFQIQENHRALTAAQSKSEETIRQLTDQLASQMAEQSTQIESTRATIESLAEKAAFRQITDLDKMRDDIDAQQKALVALNSKFDKIADVILDEHAPAFSYFIQEQQPFTYFHTHRWQVQQDSLKIALQQVPTPLVSESQDKIITLRDSRPLHVDGIFFPKLQTVEAANGLPNSIFVKAPGLAALDKEDVLRITGDAYIDRITLDGCLSWLEDTKPQNSEKEFKTWRATDIKKDTRTVLISKNVQIRRDTECDNRYINAYKYPILLNKLKNNPDIETQLQPKQKETVVFQRGVMNMFTGIGVTFKISSDSTIPETGLKIDDVVPDQPAARAGLMQGDRVTKVDGQPIAGMKVSEAINKIRGKIGTSVSLTYQRANRKTDLQVEVIRKNIEIFGNIDTTYAVKQALLRWQPVPEAEATFITRGREDNKGTLKSFFIKNSGTQASKPLQLRVETSLSQGAAISSLWDIDPRSNCLTHDINADEICHVIVRALPQHDGQIQGYIKLSPYSSNPRDALFLKGYASGIGGQLPPHVLGNGAACPAPGASVEIALSFNTDKESGYFSTGADGGVTLFTANCSAWKKKTDEDLFYCEEKKIDSSSQELREYKSASIDGPWQATGANGRGVSATFTCKNNVIDWIDTLR